MTGRQVFIRKKAAFDSASNALAKRLEERLHIQTSCVVYALYEVEGLDTDSLFYFQQEILGDVVTDEISNAIETEGRSVLAYTLLAGHFDQRAYYAQQAGALVLDHDAHFSVRSSTVVVFDSVLAPEQLQAVRAFLINRVESRERSIGYEEPPTPVQREMVHLSGFETMQRHELTRLRDELKLSMDIETLTYIQQYYRERGTGATETELYVFDTYWSDHCRHTTFLTRLGSISFHGAHREAMEASYRRYLSQREELGREGHVTLMDLATHSQRYLRAKGSLKHVEQSKEINACSIHVSDIHDDYLLMFKNETHNHPTEIEPFGGAQTCLGGAIRDPLSGRSFVYQGVRISGAADPTTDIGTTLENKLSQSTIVQESARGFSSYGNQIGMATTYVREIYHPSYVAKHLELGAVVGMTRTAEVVRKDPLPKDIVVLLGGKTGKDGIGGASGSSLSHTSESLDTSYAQIQKGNPLEERRLQRLFRIPEVKRVIKRANDFGAGGVSVAIGELAEGIAIDLSAIPLKVQKMNATEIAISESQERMAVLIAPQDLQLLQTFAAQENVEATRVAEVLDEPRLIMHHHGKIVVDIDRAFLNTNGPLPTQDVVISDYRAPNYDTEQYRTLNEYSQKGLAEIFDSSVGNSTLFSPYGGVYQSTEELSSVHRFPFHSDSDKASVVSFGFDPTFAEVSPYCMGMCSVLSSVAKQRAVGARLAETHLSFQEYFPKPGTDPERWGLVWQALLGAFAVSDALNLAPIGGKDSMSGSYEELDVVPTLISFAFGPVDIDRLRPRSFQGPDEYIFVLKQKINGGIPDIESFKRNCEIIDRYRNEITAISTLDQGLLHTLECMSVGNEIGYSCSKIDDEKNPGGFVFTTKRIVGDLEPIGKTISSFDPSFRDRHMQGLSAIHPMVESPVHDTPVPDRQWPKRYYHTTVDRPKVLILTFSGTNSELDMEMNFRQAGGSTRVFVLNDTAHEAFEESVGRFLAELETTHILVIPGGFSYSDEPDGSGKLIATFLKRIDVRTAIDRFLQDDRLILGICNGFQGLVKSGLLPYGTVQERKEGDVTLFFNDAQKHVAKLVKTRIHSNRSPWLQELDRSTTYTLPVSHSEGKFVADPTHIAQLIAQDQIATTYVDNPNGSVLQIEGIVSPDGNILGKMAHNERSSDKLFLNVPGTRRQDIFMSGIEYFRRGGIEPNETDIRRQG